MLWQTDLSLAPPARAEPVLGPELRRAEPAATSAQAAVAAVSTERRWSPWEVHPCLLTVWVEVVSGLDATVAALLLQPVQLHEELGGPAFTQVSPLLMAAPGPTRTLWAGWLGWLCRVLMC